MHVVAVVTRTVAFYIKINFVLINRRKYNYINRCFSKRLRTANIKDFVYGILCESLYLLDADNLKYKPRFKYLKFLAVTY
jgi:hypothetical protein